MAKIIRAVREALAIRHMEQPCNWRIYHQL
jgi:hypothetical protein